MDRQPAAQMPMRMRWDLVRPRKQRQYACLSLPSRLNQTFMAAEGFLSSLQRRSRVFASRSAGRAPRFSTRMGSRISPVVALYVLGAYRSSSPVEQLVPGRWQVRSTPCWCRSVCTLGFSLVHRVCAGLVFASAGPSDGTCALHRLPGTRGVVVHTDIRTGCCLGGCKGLGVRGGGSSLGHLFLPP